MRVVLVLCAGTFMLLSALAHAFIGWPSVREALQAAGNPEELVSGLAAGWFFGTASMATFGAIVLSAGRRLRRGDRSALGSVRWIATCYLVFGLAAYVLRGFAPHFLLFVGTGVLAGIPAFVWRRRDEV